MKENKPVKTAEETEKKLDELFLELREINNVFAAARKDLKPLGEEYSERLIRTQEICEEITELKKPLVEYLKKPVKTIEEVLEYLDKEMEAVIRGKVKRPSSDNETHTDGELMALEFVREFILGQGEE